MRSKLLVSGLFCLVALVWAGAAYAQEMETVEEGAPPPEGEPGPEGDPGASNEISVDYYTPEYYENYPVFYDEGGLPIYYVGGVRYYVPRTYVRFNGLLGHYRAHRHNYLRWYNARGRRYHGYRRVVRVGGDFSPLYHDGYAVFYTDGGVPYYYVGDRMVYVPASHPSYHAYRRHYTTYRPRYQTWYRTHGARYRVRVAPAATPYGRRYAPAPAAYGRPVHVRPAQPGYHGGAVDCRANPGHPACRRGHGPSPYTPRDRGRGRRYH